MRADTTWRGGRWTVIALAVGMIGVLALTVAMLVSLLEDPHPEEGPLYTTWAFVMTSLIVGNTTYRVLRRRYDSISTVRRRFDMVAGSTGCAMALLLFAAMFVVGPALHSVAVATLVLAAGLSLLAEGRLSSRRVG